MSQAWIWLCIAGLLEVGWTVGLKYTDGFSRWIPSVFTVAALSASMFFLAKSVQVIPIGTAYAIWVGIGSLGAAIMGIFLFQEPAAPQRLFFLLLLLVSLVGLKFTS